MAFVGGRYDLVAMVFSRTPEELSHFTRKISAEASILRIESIVNLDIIKTPWLQTYDIRALMNAVDLFVPESNEFAVKESH